MHHLKTYKGRYLAVLVIAGLIALMFLVSPVLAQDPTPTSEPAATAVPTATSTTDTSRSPSEILSLLNSSEFGKFVARTLAVTVLMWVILFGYTFYIQKNYLTTAEQLAKRGIIVVPTVKGAETFGQVPGVANAELKIEGPKVVTVGKESDEYKVTTESTPTLAYVEWSVDPSDAASVNPSKGQSTKVIAAKSGAFQLKVAVKINGTEPEPQTGSISVSAIGGETQKKIEIPVFGQAYGTIAIAIVVLAIVLILGVSTVLPGAAISTLLGTLVAYIFSRTPPGSSGGNNNQSPPASGEQ